MGHSASDSGGSGKAMLGVQQPRAGLSVTGAGGWWKGHVPRHDRDAKSNWGARERDKLNFCFLGEQHPESQTTSHC